MPAAETQAILDRHAPAWAAATRHPFLDGVREGTLPPETFARWLTQDRHFVAGLYRAQARIAALAPERDWRALDGGLTALLDELDWFDRHQQRFAVDRAAAPAPVCRAFLDFLTSLAFAPYAVAIGGLWAVEQAYLDAWTYARPGAEGYREFVEHWTTPEFAAYVQALDEAADRALRAAAEADRAAAAEAVEQVAAYERAFWEMSLRGEA